MKPVQVVLGDGLVCIHVFRDRDGGRGIFFSPITEDCKKPHCDIAPPVTDHAPKDGEVFVRCKNRESALVLLEQVARVVAGFTS